MSGWFVFVVVGWLLTTGNQATNCSAPAELHIVRIDDRSARLFVQESAEAIQKLRKPKQAEDYMKRLRVFVAACRPEWKDGWRASFFSEAKLAGYKDEEAIAPHVQSGAWGRGYLGEYTEADGLFVFYPLQPKKRVSLRLKGDKAGGG